MNKLLKLAIDNLKYCEWINVWEYTIKNEFKWKIIYKNDKKIGVVIDWETFINWFRKRIDFEVSVDNDRRNLIDFIEKKFEEAKKKIIDIDSEKTRLEATNIELRKKLEDKAVEDAKTFLNDPFINHE